MHIDVVEDLSSTQVPLRVVRYEDAVGDPAATFSDLLAFMGVAVDRRRLAAAAKIQVAARPPPKTFGDRLSAVCATGWTAARPGPAATHRAAGPSLAEATILSVAGPTARRLGYRINGTLSWWVSLAPVSRDRQSSPQGLWQKLLCDASLSIYTRYASPLSRRSAHRV